MEKTLLDCLLDEGIKGKIFRGIAGGRQREYTPLNLSVTGDVCRGASLVIRLVEDNIPQKILSQREKTKKFYEAVIKLKREHGYVQPIADFENEIFADYTLPLSRHYRDLFVRNLT